MLKIQFLGGAETVTGSKTLLDNGRSKLLVDCGLFQGLKALRLLNRAPLPITPREISAVILTHAHLDHTGYLPLLVKQGFRGRVFCTAPTRELTRLVLLDAAHLQEEDASFANLKGFSKHSPALPLFTVEDAERAISLLEVVRDAKDFEPSRGFKARFKKNGHILGSCSLLVEADHQRLTFSGDLGRPRSLLHAAPEPLDSTDALVVESTYGDRLHTSTDDQAIEALAVIVNDTYQRQGTLIIPSFAIGRTQEILHMLATLSDAHKIPDLPLYLDTPMGERATDIFASYPAWHSLNVHQVERLQTVCQIVKSTEQSIRMMRSSTPKIVIAGSGMAAGGRVLHHLAHGLPDPRCTVLFVGFQAAGTRGRSLLEGASEVKIHGKLIPVKARITALPQLSAHADQNEILAWLKTCPRPPRWVFLQHGEPDSARALQAKIKETLGWDTLIPRLGEAVDLI